MHPTQGGARSGARVRPLAAGRRPGWRSGDCHGLGAALGTAWNLTSERAAGRRVVRRAAVINARRARTADPAGRALRDLALAPVGRADRADATIAVAAPPDRDAPRLAQPPVRTLPDVDARIAEWDRADRQVAADARGV